MLVSVFVNLSTPIIFRHLLYVKLYNDLTSNFVKRTRQAVLNHRRKKSLLTVKESMADSGRSSKTSSSCATGAGPPSGRRNKVNGQQLLPATPSDLLRDESISLFSSVPCEQYGSFYLRLGTVCKFII